MRDDYHGQVNLATVDDLFVVRSSEIFTLNKGINHEIDGGNKMHLLFWRIIVMIKQNICPFLSQAPWYWHVSSELYDRTSIPVFRPGLRAHADGKRTGVLPQDLVKSRIRKIRV